MRLKILIVALAAAVLVPAMPQPASAASARIRMVKIQYDSPGSDTGTNSSINSEYVVLKNVGTARGNLNGYTIRDAAGHVRKLGTRYLDPGQSVYLRTGTGYNTATSLYWGSSWYIWNNTADTATWFSPAGSLLQTCKWTSLGTGSKTCAY